MNLQIIGYKKDISLFQLAGAKAFEIKDDTKFNVLKKYIKDNEGSSAGFLINSSLFHKYIELKDFLEKSKVVWMLLPTSEEDFKFSEEQLEAISERIIGMKIKI